MTYDWNLLPLRVINLHSCELCVKKWLVVKPSKNLISILNQYPKEIKHQKAGQNFARSDVIKRVLPAGQSLCIKSAVAFALTIGLPFDLLWHNRIQSDWSISRLPTENYCKLDLSHRMELVYERTTNVITGWCEFVSLHGTVRLLFSFFRPRTPV